LQGLGCKLERQCIPGIDEQLPLPLKQALDAIDSDTANRVISAGAVIRSLAIEQLVPGAAVAEELLTIDLAGFAERSGSFPQIGITWARLTNALREGLEPGTVRLGHKLAGLVVEATSSGSGSGGVSNSAGGTGGVTLTFEAPRSGAVAPPPVFVRGCVVGADGRNSRVRELAFDDKMENTLSTSSSPSSSPAAHTPATFPAFNASDGRSAKGPSGDAGATVYYALSPNPPPGAGGTGSFNEMRFSLCNGSGITLLDVGRGNLDLDGGGDEAQVPGSNSSGGQLMFGTTRFTEAAPTFETPEARLGHLRSFFVDTTPLLQASIAATEPRAVVQTQLFERASAQRWSKAGR